MIRESFTSAGHGMEEPTASSIPFMRPILHRPSRFDESGSPEGLRASRPDEPGGEDGGVGHGGPGERSLEHGVGAVGARPYVHDHVVNLVVGVEVVIEKQVTGF